MRMGSMWLAFFLMAGFAQADRYNGFNLSKATIPISKILSGGPPRDGIPAIDEPRFIAPATADFMRADDEVLSVTVGDEVRAYPLRILVRHEIVNDEIGGKPVVITYCPLCGTAMVFSRSFGARTLDFGVSGLLYQSDVLMYDRETESLWSQLAMSAVSGPLVNTELEWLPSQQLTWGAWKKQYPQGNVLSVETGFPRDYSKDAYVRYRQNPGTMFPVPTHREELLPKEWVIGVMVNGVAHAYPFDTLAEFRALEDGLVKITYDSESQQVTAENSVMGDVLPSVKVYWFAWQAFYPETELWQTAVGTTLLHEEFENLDRWEPLTFPKIPTHSTYAVVQEEGHAVLRSESKASASGLLLKESFDVKQFPVLSWRWKVDRVYTGADPQKKSGDDYPIRIYVIFEYDPEQAGFSTRMKYRLAKARYGKYPPLAALNYVWASTEAAEPFYFSPYSDRSAMIPLETGAGKVGIWVEERINLAEDYRRIFGGEPPARATLAIMNDSDNTGSSAVSYIDDIEIRTE